MSVSPTDTLKGNIYKAFETFAIESDCVENKIAFLKAFLSGVTLNIVTLQTIFSILLALLYLISVGTYISRKVKLLLTQSLLIQVYLR